MSSSLLSKVADVEIDPDGKFKYILIKVTNSSQEEDSKLVVRGNKRGAYHDDIFKETVAKYDSLGLKFNCLGGGKIKHDPELKKINVFGQSTGYGKADHNLSVAILKKSYPNYGITISEED